MHVICTATVEDERQRDNLCRCVMILGGMPIVDGEVVSVEYMGDDMKASKMADLFEEYTEHTLDWQQ